MFQAFEIVMHVTVSMLQFIVVMYKQWTIHASIVTCQSNYFECTQSQSSVLAMHGRTLHVDQNHSNKFYDS